MSCSGTYWCLAVDSNLGLPFMRLIHCAITTPHKFSALNICIDKFTAWSNVFKESHDFLAMCFFSLSLSFLQIKYFLNIPCPYIYSFIKQDNVKLDGHGFILWLIKWLPLLQIPDNPKSYVTLLWIFCCIYKGRLMRDEA